MMERAVLSRQNVQSLTRSSHECYDRKLTPEPAPTTRNAGTENCDCSRHPVTQFQDMRNVEDFQDRQPYQAVGISREAIDTMHLTSSTAVKYKSVKDNLSDSAYSSLCPQLTCKDTDKSHKNIIHSFPDQQQLRTNHFECAEEQNILCKDDPKPEIDRLCNSDCEVTGRMTQKLFENVTHAMEDWYERRLKEITEKQQRDMNMKVAELENKVKMLELSQNHQTSST